MELQLHRIDLLQTSAAAPGTLVVLPPGENKTQKVAVGDLSGAVQCFCVKKGEVALTFKTLPSPQKACTQPPPVLPHQLAQWLMQSRWVAASLRWTLQMPASSCLPTRRAGNSNSERSNGVWEAIVDRATQQDRYAAFSTYLTTGDWGSCVLHPHR
eukprot:GHRQ01037474.1.p1 GENE.GHRQ01037474.1~~GHRQ01037474.1.p1  ORF type:complete len:156 (+),score=21.45 GHRQ01037474.1:730-1197(+)